MSIRAARKLASVIFVVSALFQGLSSTTSAQLYTADPYDPPGRAFRQYAYPGADEGYPGSYAARARIVRPNQFDRADDDLGFPTSGLNTRRRFESDADRLYNRDRDFIPNAKADKQYIVDRERRERAMLKATLERDPKKRDQMVREAEQDARKGSSELSLSVRRSATTGTRIPPAPSRPSSSARSANAATGAPGSAIPSAPARRSSGAAASGTTGAAPAPRRGVSTSTPATGSRPSIPPPPSSSRSRSIDPSDPLLTDVPDGNQTRERERPRTISTRRLP